MLPKNALDDLRAMHKEFIWDSKKPKIKHSTLIGHYEDGGFRDVELPAKFRSIKKMSDKSNFHPWIAVADKILKPLGGIDTFYTSLQLSLEFQSVLAYGNLCHMANATTSSSYHHKTSGTTNFYA